MIGCLHVQKGSQCHQYVTKKSHTLPAPFKAFAFMRPYSQLQYRKGWPISGNDARNWAILHYIVINEGRYACVKAKTASMTKPRLPTARHNMHNDKPMRLRRWITIVDHFKIIRWHRCKRLLNKWHKFTKELLLHQKRSAVYRKYRSVRDLPLDTDHSRNTHPNGHNSTWYHTSEKSVM